ncbi:hypothetical protein GHT06_020674 [Daphnia sinensis]|uniref:Uncharacterized protein n=1 Tax=Daphnia sinensis TaxID=1820382 RepID=A0AAD5PQ64_9CRUS|nr:hypothetical protein GHT06_020674 [Daphnia sinensis]
MHFTVTLYVTLTLKNSAKRKMSMINIVLCLLALGRTVSCEPGIKHKQHIYMKQHYRPATSYLLPVYRTPSYHPAYRTPVHYSPPMYYPPPLYYTPAARYPAPAQPIVPYPTPVQSPARYPTPAHPPSRYPTPVQPAARYSRPVQPPTPSYYPHPDSYSRSNYPAITAQHP